MASDLGRTGPVERDIEQVFLIISFFLCLFLFCYRLVEFI
jgi:hypothetical protein